MGDYFRLGLSYYRNFTLFKSVKEFLIYICLKSPHFIKMPARIFSIVIATKFYSSDASYVSSFDSKVVSATTNKHIVVIQRNVRPQVNKSTFCLLYIQAWSVGRNRYQLSIDTIAINRYETPIDIKQLLDEAKHDSENYQGGRCL